MSSRFDNLIQSVFNKFEYDEYTLLLAEALSVAKIQDELKAKGVDIDAYNSKHHLFILALINSNLNLDVYNQLITTIKDQGILNRLMSQTVDRRSDKPTVDFEIINKVLQNANNIPEINSILNSISQTREKKTDTGPKEYAAGQSPAERYLIAAEKLIVDSITKDFGDQLRQEDIVQMAKDTINHLNEILSPWKEKYKDDRLLQTNVYLLGFINSIFKSKIDLDYDLIKEVIDMYFTYPDLLKNNLIFNEPYKDDFYGLSNYLYEYIDEKEKRATSESDAQIYKDEDITVYQGTVEDHGESIRRCIKYGKGPKHGLCISSKSSNLYTSYRLGRQTDLTTYFVYINKPEDIVKYGAKDGYDNDKDIDFFLIDAYTPYGRGTDYQYNPVYPNQEYTVSTDNLIDKYPIIEKAFNAGVFKVLPVSQKERETVGNINIAPRDVHSAKDFRDLIRYNIGSLMYTSGSLDHFYRKYPQIFDYAFNTLLKNRDKFFHDIVDDRDSVPDYAYNHYINPINMQEFTKDKPKYEKIVSKYLENDYYNNALAAVTPKTSSIDANDLELFEENGLSEEQITYLVKKYLDYKKVDITDTKSPVYIYESVASVSDYLKTRPNIGNKFKEDLKEIDEIFKQTIPKIGYSNDPIFSDNWNTIKKYFPNEVDELLQQYVSKKIDFYTTKKSNQYDDYYDDDDERSSRQNYDNIDHAVFAPINKFLEDNPSINKKFIEQRKKLIVTTFTNFGKSYKILRKDSIRDLFYSTPKELHKLCLDAYLSEKVKLYSSEEEFQMDYRTYYDDERNYYAQSTEDYESFHVIEVPDMLDVVFSKAIEYSSIDQMFDDDPNFFKKYDEARLKNKYKIINNLKLRTQVIGTTFLNSTYQHFPNQTDNIIEYYLNNKLGKIEDYLTNAKDDKDRLERKYQFNEGNIYTFIYGPLHAFFGQDQEVKHKIKKIIKSKLDIIGTDYIENYIINPNYASIHEYNNHGFQKGIRQILQYSDDFNNNKILYFEKVLKKAESIYSNDESYYQLFLSYEKVIDVLNYVKNYTNGDYTKIVNSLINKHKDKIIITSCKYFYKMITEYPKFIEKESLWSRTESIYYNILNATTKYPDSLYAAIFKLIPKYPNLLLSYLYKDPDNKLKYIKFDPIIKFIFDIPFYDIHVKNNNELKDLIYNILIKLNYSNGDILDSKSYQRFLDQPASFKGIKEYVYLLFNKKQDLTDNPVYKHMIERDENNINYYKNHFYKKGTIKTINGVDYNVIEGQQSLDVRFNFNPPDLSKYIFTDECRIKIDVNFINTLKWLPYQVGGNNSKLEIISNNIELIDHIPYGLINLSLNGCTLSDNFKIIGKFPIRTIFLAKVKNLKNLRSFQNFKNISIVHIQQCDDLISLEGFPTVVRPNRIILEKLPNLNSFEGMPDKVDTVDLRDLNIKSFIGISKSNEYIINSGVIYSFKGLPKTIKSLILTKPIMNACKEMFPVRYYKEFPSYIEEFEVSNNVQNCLFSKLKDSFPRLGGQSKIKLIKGNNKRFATAYKQYVDRVSKKQDKNRSTKKRVKAVQAKRAKPLSREEEIENIERQQDKAANKEKIKRLSKEDLELVTPFNVLLEDIVNTIKTSFKVYK